MVQFSAADHAFASADGTILALDDLRQACEQTVTQLKAQNGWDDRDLRVVCIHRLRNLIQSTLANRVFRLTVFPAESFWDTFFGARPTNDEMTDHVRELDMLGRFAAFQGLFSCLESDARMLVRALDANACNQGKAAAASILAWLIARVPNTSTYSDFAKLLRLTRNTVHNNGTYHPERGQNDRVRWRNTDYAFVVGQPIDHVTWDFVVMVAQDILELLRLFVTDPTTVALPRVERMV